MCSFLDAEGRHEYGLAGSRRARRRHSSDRRSSHLGALAMSSSARFRETVWEASEVEGNGTVSCNLCHGRVWPTDSWAVSHVGTPAALGGTDIGVAHKLCNDRDNISFVIPLVARAKRLRRRHLGITGPGLGDNPLPGGRRANVSKKLNGEVVPRVAGKGAKHRQTMAQFPNRRPS
jgi:hypothetical protein